MSSFFITGTDTDVGKTVTTALLAAFFNKQGKSVIPYKPVQSGAIDEAGKYEAPDVKIYQLALPALNEDEASSYLFKTPSSPHLAAREEEKTILPEKILQHIRMLEQKYETVLVEGAGGLIVPLQDDGYTMMNLIKEVAAPVILVARAGVGTINHTVLSVMAMRDAGIPIAGIILNRIIECDPVIEQDNKRMIENLTDVPVIGMIPFIKSIEEMFGNEEILAEIFASLQIEI